MKLFNAFSLFQVYRKPALGEENESLKKRAEKSSKKSEHPKKVHVNGNVNNSAVSWYGLPVIVDMGYLLLLIWVNCYCWYGLTVIVEIGYLL